MLRKSEGHAKPDRRVTFRPPEFLKMRDIDEPVAGPESAIEQPSKPRTDSVVTDSVMTAAMTTEVAIIGCCPFSFYGPCSCAAKARRQREMEERWNYLRERFWRGMALQ